MPIIIHGSNTGGVNSFNGRNRDVMPKAGDYTPAMVGMGDGVLYNKEELKFSKKGFYDKIFTLDSGVILTRSEDTFIAYNKYDNKLSENNLFIEGINSRVASFVTVMESENKVLGVTADGVVYESEGKNLIGWEEIGKVSTGSVTICDGIYCVSGPLEGSFVVVTTSTIYSSSDGVTWSSSVYRTGAINSFDCKIVYTPEFIYIINTDGVSGSNVSYSGSLETDSWQNTDLFEIVSYNPSTGLAEYGTNHAIISSVCEDEGGWNIYYTTGNYVVRLITNGELSNTVVKTGLTNPKLFNNGNRDSVYLIEGLLGGCTVYYTKQSLWDSSKEVSIDIDEDRATSVTWLMGEIYNNGSKVSVLTAGDSFFITNGSDISTISNVSNQTLTKPSGTDITEDMKSLLSPEAIPLSTIEEICGVSTTYAEGESF